MMALVLCVLCSVMVSVLFKWARPRGLQAAQAVAVNYVVAIAATLILLRPNIAMSSLEAMPWGILLLLGVLLPTVFVVMVQAVSHAGMVRADAAQRLSLCLPLLAAATFLGEQITGLKAVGLGLALVGVIALVWRPQAQANKNELTQTSGLLLLLVWLGYGVCDILFKQIAKTGTQFSVALLTAFVCAAVLIWGYLLSRKTEWHVFSLRCGVVLGALNFANIYFYIKAHQALHETPSVVFAGVNIGVLALAMLIGTVFWKERLNKVNLAGFGLAVAAVLCLYAAMG